MTKVTYRVGKNENFITCDTYASALQTQSDNPGFTITTCYEPIPETPNLFIPKSGDKRIKL